MQDNKIRILFTFYARQQGTLIIGGLSILLELVPVVNILKMLATSPEVSILLSNRLEGDPQTSSSWGLVKVSLSSVCLGSYFSGIASSILSAYATQRFGCAQLLLFSISMQRINLRNPYARLWMLLRPQKHGNQLYSTQKRKTQTLLECRLVMAIR